MDTLFGPVFDLTHRATQQVVLRWIRNGWVFYIHFGTPCQAWSIARRNIGDFAKARLKELVAVSLALFTAECVRLCHRCGVLWSIENPATSKLRNFSPISSLCGLGGVLSAAGPMHARR